MMPIPCAFHVLRPFRDGWFLYYQVVRVFAGRARTGLYLGRYSSHASARRIADFDATDCVTRGTG